MARLRNLGERSGLDSSSLKTDEEKGEFDWEINKIITCTFVYVQWNAIDKD